MATNAILPEADTMKTTAKQTAVPTAARRWQAVLDRDASLDGTFVYGAGYGSSSRLYERTAAQLGMTPEKYRRGAVAAVVRYTIATSPLGHMLIAATDKGICSIQFSDSDEQLQQGLMREFPFATRRRDDAAMTEWRGKLTNPLRGRQANPPLSLLLKGSPAATPT